MVVVLVLVVSSTLCYVFWFRQVVRCFSMSHDLFSLSLFIAVPRRTLPYRQWKHQPTRAHVVNSPNGHSGRNRLLANAPSQIFLWSEEARLNDSGGDCSCTLSVLTHCFSHVSLCRSYRLGWRQGKNWGCCIFVVVLKSPFSTWVWTWWPEIFFYSECCWCWFASWFAPLARSGRYFTRYDFDCCRCYRSVHVDVLLEGMDDWSDLKWWFPREIIDRK